MDYSDFCRRLSALLEELENPDRDVDLASIQSPEAERDFAAVWLASGDDLRATVPEHLAEALRVVDADSEAILSGGQVPSPDSVAEALEALYGFHQEDCG